MSMQLTKLMSIVVDSALCNLLMAICLRHIQLHTTELDDGYDWNRLNLKSVTEQNTLDEFLSTAQLAGTEFIAGE